MSVTGRIVSLVLLAYPRAFRDRYGESLLETFELAYRDRRGFLPRVGFLLRSPALLLLEGMKERLRPSVRSRASIHEHPATWNGRGSWFFGEFRLAARSLVNRPSFSLLIVATLAVGFGGNAAIFSVVNAVLLEPLPYEDPEKIVLVFSDWRGPDPGIGSMSYPDIFDLEQRARTLDSLVGVNRSSMTLAGLGETRVIEVGRLTKGLMGVFGTEPVLGRDLKAEEFDASGPTVAVLSFAFWQANFAGSPNALGKTFRLGDFDYEIVGVAPASFDYPRGMELWIPRRLDLQHCGRGCHSMIGVGRIASGATLEQAKVELDSLGSNLEEAYPDTNATKGFVIRTLPEESVADVRSGLLMLLGAVGLLLLIACSNVANLLLARATSRRAEVAIRTALGAGRAHLVVQGLIESFVLAVAGGVVGLALARALLVGFPLLTEPLPGMERMALNLDVLIFTGGAIVMTTFLFGAAPAFALLRSSVRSGLGQATHGGTAGNARFRRALLVAEVSLSTVLLIGAGLLLKSFVGLYEVDVGFETKNMARFNVILPQARYETVSEIANFYRELEVRLQAIPGVEDVGSSWGPPLGRGHATGSVLVSGRPEPPPELEREAAIHSVSPHWLETMRIRVIRGRGLSPADDLGPAAVAIVNETFARQIFAGEDPIGQRVKISVSLGYGSPEWAIVGVTSDILSEGLTVEPESQIYVPHGMFGPENMTVALRTAPSAPSPLPAARAIVSEMEPLAPIYRVETVEQALAREISPTRLYLILTGTFAVLAALLAAVGLYGVVSESSAERTREIGLRLALGARTASVHRLVLVQGMGPTFVGLSVGLIAAYFGGRVMASIVFAVDPRDPWVFGASALLLLSVALVATSIPAGRASRIDPVRALKLE